MPGSWRGWPRSSGAPRAIRVDLEPFGRDELAELLAGVLGEPPSAELAGRVYERSGGNAFLAEELLAAGERGVLVPATVRSVMLARMAGLTVPARGLLRLAAVAGVRVGHGLLAAAGDLGDDVLLAAARELAENHLLVADRSGEGYVFRHALTREAVYDDLLPGERQQLHRAMARALTDEPALGPPAGWAVAEAVAEHWFAAGELEPALAASVAAGNAAREVVAVADALAPLRAGAGPVGSGGRPRDGGRRRTTGVARTGGRGRQRCRRARSRYPLCRCRHRRAGAHRRPADAARSAVRAEGLVSLAGRPRASGRSGRDAPWRSCRPNRRPRNAPACWLTHAFALAI